MSRIKEQLNFNTLLISVVGGLVLFAVKKLDETNTAMIQLTVRMNVVEARVNTVEGFIYTRH